MNVDLSEIPAFASVPVKFDGDIFEIHCFLGDTVADRFNFSVGQTFETIKKYIQRAYAHTNVGTFVGEPHFKIHTYPKKKHVRVFTSISDCEGRLNMIEIIWKRV